MDDKRFHISLLGSESFIIVFGLVSELTCSPMQWLRLTIIVSYLRSGCLVSRLCGYAMLHGLEAGDLASVVRKFADDWQLDLAKLLCLSADGASVNSATCPRADKDSRNLAAAFRRWRQRPMLAIQCSGHKLQLVASDSWTNEYLKQLEKVISSIFKHMSKHPPSKPHRQSLLVGHH